MEDDEIVEVLLVEDNLGDARLVREAFNEGHLNNELHHVRDGVEAMGFLRDRVGNENGALPALILLDLNLPRKSGFEVLEEIKGDPELRFIPVVILTSSKTEMDLVKTYDLKANSYIVKPLDLDRFIDIIRAVGDFWFSLVKLPPRRRG